MAKKRRTRRFLITVEIEEVDQKPDQVAHQAPPPIQTREPGWMEQQELPPRRRRRARTDSEG
jgi:hypothetical protein